MDSYPNYGHCNHGRLLNIGQDNPVSVPDMPTEDTETRTRRNNVNYVTDMVDDFEADKCKQVVQVDQENEGKPRIPTDLIRLDPLFKTAWKLFVKDLAKLKLWFGLKNIYIYNGHPVQTVTFIGVVRMFDPRRKCIIYAVDDGTGCIKVCQFRMTANPSNLYPKDAVDMYGANSGSEDDESCDFSCLSSAANDATKYGGSCEIMEYEFELGDLVRVHGRLNTYLGSNEVVAYFIERVTDPNAALAQMGIRMDLYKNYYLQPPVVPACVHQMMTPEGRLKCQEEQRIGETVQIIQNFLEKSTNKKMISIFTDDLICVPGVKEMIAALKTIKRGSALEKALKSLVEKGVIYQENLGAYSHIKNKWMVVLNDADLERQILNILHSDKSRMAKDCRMSEWKGTHKKRLCSVLNKECAFKQLTMTAVERCLDVLEEHGKIYGGTSIGYYMPFVCTT